MKIDIEVAIYVAIVVVIAMLIAIPISYKQGQQQIKNQAVKVGVAVWGANQNGESKFMWKSDPLYRNE